MEFEIVKMMSYQIYSIEDWIIIRSAFILGELFRVSVSILYYILYMTFRIINNEL